MNNKAERERITDRWKHIQRIQENRTFLEQDADDTFLMGVAINTFEDALKYLDTIDELREVVENLQERDKTCIQLNKDLVEALAEIGRLKDRIADLHECIKT